MDGIKDLLFSLMGHRCYCTSALMVKAVWFHSSDDEPCLIGMYMPLGQPSNDFLGGGRVQLLWFSIDLKILSSMLLIYLSKFTIPVLLNIRISSFVALVHNLINQCQTDTNTHGQFVRVHASIRRDRMPPFDDSKRRWNDSTVTLTIEDAALN